MTLVQLGYPHKQIFNAILIWKFQTIDEYIDAFSEQNGKINHNFEASDFDRCFICQRVEEQHNEFIQDVNKGIELNKTNGQSKETKDIELKIKELTPFVLKLSNNDESLLPILRDVFEAKNEYLNAALDTIKDNYGSLDNYIVNVLKVDVDFLRNKFLK